MIFYETKLLGAYIIEIEKIIDNRGFFARVWDRKIFEERGLDSNIIQSSLSFNKKRGTLRGMHFQIAPYEESKFIRCIKGKIYDVIIDLRPSSKTFKNWVSVELSDLNHKILYVPKGFAHGFQTLEDNSEVQYDITQIQSLEHSRGIRWDDSSFKIAWPLEITEISKKDKEYKPIVE